MLFSTFLSPCFPREWTALGLTPLVGLTAPPCRLRAAWSPAPPRPVPAFPVSSLEPGPQVLMTVSPPGPGGSVALKGEVTCQETSPVVPDSRAPRAPVFGNYLCVWLPAACFLASPNTSPTQLRPRPAPLALARLLSGPPHPPLSTLLFYSQVHGQPLCPVWPGEWQSWVGPRMWMRCLGWNPVSH